MPERRLSEGSLRVLVIIPAFNEAASLPGLVHEIRSLHPGLDILLVDDGSTDETRSVVSSLRVRALSLPSNLGVGGAVQAALMFAARCDYDIAIQLDGDGQHPPKEIGKLLRAIRESGSDMVIGSRFLGTNGYQSTFGRRLAVRFFSAILSALCGRRITDATSGFRAWSRRAIRILAANYPEDYPEVEAILILHRAALQVSEIPVQMLDRAAGKSSIGTLEAITYMIKVPLAILMNLLRGQDRVSLS